MEGLTDEQIAAMTPRQRRDLIYRLSRPVEQVVHSRSAMRRRRRLRLAMVTLSVVGLPPWIVYLAMSSPDHYVAAHWRTAWVGFDVLLLGTMATTAYLGWHRRQLVVLAAFATGVLLVCDAWFDVMTAQPDDVWLSVLFAGLAELPMAYLLISGAIGSVRMVAERFYVTHPGTRLWQVPMLALRPAELAAIDRDGVEPGPGAPVPADPAAAGAGAAGPSMQVAPAAASG